MKSNTIEIFVTDLTAYVSGELKGRWFDMADYDDLDDMLKKCDIPSTHEWFITDYSDRVFDCGEYPNLSDLDNLHELALADNDAIFDYLEAYDVETVAEHLDDLYLIDAEDETHLAYEIVDEMGLLSGVPENVAMYFDYDAYGRDLVLSGDFTKTSNGFVNRI